MSAQPEAETSPNSVFLKVLLNMKTTEMASIPAERWPQRLSLKLLESLPLSKQRVVARILKLRGLSSKSEPHSVAKPAAQLLTQLEPDLQRWLCATEVELQNAENIVRSWRELKPNFNAGRRLKTTPTTVCPLDDEADRLFEQSIDRGSALALQLNSKRMELTQMVQAMSSLQHDEAEARSSATQALLQSGRKLIGRLQTLASRYYQLRLNLVCMEMQRSRDAIARCARRKKHLHQDIARVSNELKQASSWKARLSGKSNHEQIEALRDMGSALDQELGSCFHNVPREEMHGWLNAIVDAHLDQQCSDVARTQIDRALTLFVDLARYRRRIAIEKLRDTTQQLAGGQNVDDSRLIVNCIDGHRAEVWQQLLIGEDKIRQRLARLRERLLGDYVAATAQRQAVFDRRSD